MQSSFKIKKKKCRPFPDAVPIFGTLGQSEPEVGLLGRTEDGTRTWVGCKHPPGCLQVALLFQQMSCPTSVPSSPTAVTNPQPALGTRWILHPSQRISSQAERSCFQTRSCGFTYTGRRRSRSPAALRRCWAPHRLAHSHCCGEKTSPFLWLCLF